MRTSTRGRMKRHPLSTARLPGRFVPTPTISTRTSNRHFLGTIAKQIFKCSTYIHTLLLLESTTMRLSLALALLVAAAVATTTTTSANAAATENSGPPPFFLQDPKDSLCLGGETFKRCSINTLWYVVGTPGTYSIHLYGENDDVCLSKKDCKDATKLEGVKLNKCLHCGAKNWNILGDAESGYVLTEGDGATCLVRQGTKAMTTPCDSEDVTYTPLQLQFASAADIAAMSTPGARLIGAASDGDKKTVQALLKDGIDVNSRDWDDLTALIPASSAGHLDICKLLVKEGIDVNAKDKDGITALMEASIMGDAKIVDFLIESGAEVDATANSGVTALWLAAGEGKTLVMNTLLSKGADATNTRVDGLTALMTASIAGHAEAVELLLEHGADPTAADGDGLTPLMNAAENGTLAVVKLLVEAAKDPVEYINHMSSTGFHALIIASAHGHVPVMEYLLDAGADPNVLHESKVTPLMYAAASGHVGAMKTLMEKAKVNVNDMHTNGGTALLEAATGGNVEAVKYLMEQGATYDFIDADGVTPLMAVASQGHLEAQTMFLEALKKTKTEQEVKDHINLASYSGGTSVMFTAAGGHLECTKQLIDHGADINRIARATPEYLAKMKDGTMTTAQPEPEPHVDGVTALHVAAQGGHLEVVNLLLEKGATVDVLDDEQRSALVLAVKNNHGDVASALVKAGADPNTFYTDEDGETTHNLLMDAITVENEEFAILLAEKGAALYYEDDKKVTTLLQASHRGLTNVVKILLEMHAVSGKSGYLDDGSDEGITPLIAAASEGHSEVVKLLVAAKADVNAKDKDGTTALMAASARGHVEAVIPLLEAGANINDQNDDGHTALMFAYNGKNQVETLWERYNQFVVEDEQSEAAQDAGTGPIIEEALANHNALVELLLKKGADPSLKDKEGHTAKDFDFHPDADAAVLNKEAAKAEKKARDASESEL